MNRRGFFLGVGGLAASGIFAESLRAADAISGSPFRLTDVTSTAGIHFQHNSGAFGGKFLPETLGAGCAFLDYDGDGWQDILLVNGTNWPGHRGQRSTLQLYRNNR